MNIKTYNLSEIDLLSNVRDQFKWHLGVELGRDPSLSNQDEIEVDMRLAEWLIDGGGKWLSNLPTTNKG